MSEERRGRGALAGVKVVECGEWISAPYCAKLLAGLGAEVIKIEPPDIGDPARSYGPFPDDMPHPERSGLFLLLNTDKLGITLNLASLTGRKILKRLLQKTDIFVTNMPPLLARERTLDWARLEQLNSQLIAVSITPFGCTGPYKDYKAYHINCCAAGGVSVGIGDPKREPLTMPLSQGGYQAGAAAAGAGLVALLARKKLGLGQHIDISETEVWANLHAGQHMLTYIYQGIAGIRQGSHGGYFNYPCGTLPCKDGHIALIAPQIEQWVRFVDVLGNPEWTNNPKYRNRRAMLEEYPDEVDALLKPWFEERTKEEIFSLCRGKRIPFCPEYTSEDLVGHPHYQARESFVEIDHPQAGKLKYPAPPYRLSKSPSAVEHHSPLLGQHNEEVFCKRLGYSREELTELRREGVI